MNDHLSSEEVSTIEWRIKERRYDACHFFACFQSRDEDAGRLCACISTALKTCPRCCCVSLSSTVLDQKDELGN